MRSLTLVFMSMLVAILASAYASSQPIIEPIVVIEAFHRALNDGDLDAAMGFVTVDARFITNSLYEGKEQVRGFYDGAIAGNSQWELSDIKSVIGQRVWSRQNPEQRLLRWLARHKAETGLHAGSLTPSHTIT